MNEKYRGYAAVVGALILVAIGAAALGNPLLGPGMVLGYPGAGAPADGAISDGWTALGWLTMLAFWGAVIAGLVVLIRALSRSRAGSAGTSAVEILRRQYEAGGITRGEYEQACQALRGRRPGEPEQAAGVGSSGSTLSDRALPRPVRSTRRGKRGA